MFFVFLLIFLDSVVWGFLFLLFLSSSGFYDPGTFGPHLLFLCFIDHSMRYDAVLLHTLQWLDERLFLCQAVVAAVVQRLTT